MEAKIHSLNFSGTFMKGEQFRDIFSSLTIPNLLQLNLSNNQLDDDCLDVLQKLLKQDCEKLCYLNLSHNEIKLNMYR